MAALTFPASTVALHLAHRTSSVDRAVVRFSHRHRVSAHLARGMLAEQVRRHLLAGPQLDGGQRGRA